MALDVAKIRRDFPILSTLMRGKPLVYLDNGATTQKPRAVIEAIVNYYETQNANIHRGVYALSQGATDLYEAARGRVQRFMNAAEAKEVIFTRGSTEGINLVAAAWGRVNLRAGDEVVVSNLEHHSNIVPWQMACEATGAVLRVIPIDEAGELDMNAFGALLSAKTKMVAVNHVSNALGTINPVAEIIRQARRVGALVLVDGAQWVAHQATDVQLIDADFYVFSGHKLFGPTGIGVLYGKGALLEAMPPYQGGGDMIASVTFAKTTYAELPNKFEAGTPDIAGVIGLGAAIGYLEGLGAELLTGDEQDVVGENERASRRLAAFFSAAAAWEEKLLARATAKLSAIKGLRIIGTAAHKAAVISFVFEDPRIASLDIGTRLDARGIAVRTGHHCCQPIMDRYGVGSTARASFAFYNTLEEVDALAAALAEIRAEFAVIAPAVPSPVLAPLPKSSAALAPASALVWPVRFADSPNAAAEKLAKTFAMLPDRDQKNSLILDYAKKLPRTFELLKQVSPRVEGCMSQVHLLGRRAANSVDALEFLGDADAEIVRGLIFVMQRIYSGQSAAAILNFDIEAFFRRIGLDEFITSQRRNGLKGMIQWIRASAIAMGTEAAK